MPPRLSVLIPMYNEEKIAADTARTLSAYFDEKFPDGDYEIVFSNDGSRDRCGEAVEELALPHVRVVGYPDNRGKGSAIREGILLCEGDVIVYTDCDLAYGCDAIYDIYRKREEIGSDLVIGSRNLSADGYEGYTFLRKLMSKTYIKVIALLAGFRYSDSQCGIKCLTKTAAHDIFSRCTVNGFAFDLEMLILADKLGYRVGEQPVRIINHRESESKVNPIQDALRMIRDVNRIKKNHKHLRT
ncbi:MAG: glycosyltransferase [Ruminococcaceae bacterium]|nr:glycosyltransferase [Oscillospiraceae bacterium]